MNELLLSLFPGADLLGMAFEAEGFCVCTGPDVLFGRDVRDFHVPAGRFDGVIGGPPCQPFSPLVHLIRANGYEPKHGDLIPEYERVVGEAQPTWFLMEESPVAPVPVIAGYAVSHFVLDNATLDSGDGFGLPQMRKRRFSFGLRGERAVDLRQWIPYAALELPETSPTVIAAYDADVQYGYEHTAKRGAVTANAHKDHDRPSDRRDAEKYDTKQRTVRGKNDGNPQPWEIAKAQAVTRDARAVPVAIGGSGKVKARAVVVREAAGGISDEKAAWQREHGKSALAPGNLKARSWAECCILQGLPPDWLMERTKDGKLHSPLFTKEGRFTVLGNGVPIPMGRTIAKAVRQAVEMTVDGGVRDRREAPAGPSFRPC